MASVLIHTCCGPCLIYPYLQLKSQGYEVFSYFYNPNIHPYKEYIRRLQTWESYVNDEEIAHEAGEYQPEAYFRAVSFHEFDRCLFCYSLRLGEAALKASEMGMDYFTSTLLVSRYQDHGAVVRVGESMGEVFEVPFLYIDFREGYYEGVEKSRQLSMYRQWYCGCLYSERERVIEKEEKWRKGERKNES